MKWILISMGAFILIAVITVFLLWSAARQNIKDKGGMENPYYTGEINSSAKDDNTGNILSTASDSKTDLS